jgi:uncharacterized protein (DUF58 family)
VSRTSKETRTHIRGVLTTRGHAFVASGLSLLACGLILGFTDVTRIGVLLTALPLLAVMVATHNRNALVATRAAPPARLLLDQDTDVTLVLTNTSNRRTRLQLAEEHVDHLLGDRPRFILPAMRPGDIREARYRIRAQVRGQYRIGPLTLYRHDPFGLANVAISMPGVSTILVLPRIELLGNGRPRTKNIGTEGAIPGLTALHGEDDVAVRNFREGDDLRRVHWPSTAHRSQLMVRQENPPELRRAVIVLDSRAAGHRGSGATGSFEWAVSATASIATHLSSHDYKFHLASSETTAAAKATQVVDIEDALATLAMAQLSTSQKFHEVLSWGRPLTATRGLVIAILTDHDETALRKAAALRPPGGTGLLVLLDSARFAQPQTQAQAQAPTARTVALADVFAGAGWSTCVADPTTSVAQAWEIIAVHSGVMVGTGR